MQHTIARLELKSPMPDYHSPGTCSFNFILMINQGEKSIFQAYLYRPIANQGLSTANHDNHHMFFTPCLDPPTFLSASTEPISAAYCTW